MTEMAPGRGRVKEWLWERGGRGGEEMRGYEEDKDQYEEEKEGEKGWQ